MRSTMPIIKWVAPLTKLYPMANSLIGQHEHPTFRHHPKTQILREYRLPRPVYRKRSLWTKIFADEKECFRWNATFITF
jgi:hypothetical protein